MSAEWVGLRELQAAVARNPRKVLSEARQFLTRGIAVYNRGILRNPWGVSSSGGGAPVRTGNLRDTHMRVVTGLMASIGPDTARAPYAKYVHSGTKRMRGRPWLEYVRAQSDSEISNLYRDMLKNITTDLAR